MNVYDEAHNLAKAIKESDEFKEYDKTKKKVDENPELSKMLTDFQGKQLELQTKQMMGEEMGAEMMESIQTLYAIIMKDPVAAEHMQNEMRFSMMMNDVYQILGDAMGMGSLLRGGDN
ncbi:MAG: YlbF family regulator [Anaerovoracaceae bacterium]|jgi:cell fate (sporulation/competence/biofilm development) regulator YlbF (YheA/YmcA/DUF963 family)|nr:YlbF family regulator [Anaerovoracaceae bacterium]